VSKVQEKEFYELVILKVAMQSRVKITGVQKLYRLFRYVQKFQIIQIKKKAKTKPSQDWPRL